MTDTKLLTLEDIERALGFIAADDRADWVKMAMSIKSEFGEVGFSVWDNWSQTAGSYNAADARSVWKSVRASGRTGIGSLIKLAQDNGFKFSVRELSTEERERRKADAIARRAENKKRREADALAHKQKNATAAARAERMWPGLPVEGQSDYLARKKIHHCGARFSRGSVVVPVRKGDNLTGLQFIAADGTKKFLTGTEKKGAYFDIPGDAGATVVCEGYATGCSIWMATRHRVLVAFDAGNLAAVVEGVAATTAGVVYLAADNDQGKPVNAGLQAAGAIAPRYATIKPVWPEFAADHADCSDFNDLHVIEGLAAVARYFEEGRAPQAIGEDLPPDNNNPDDLMPDEIPIVPDEWTRALKRTKSGNPQNLASNVALVLDHDPVYSGSLSYCDFSYRIIKRREILPVMPPGEWTDADGSHFIVNLSDKFNFEPTDTKMERGLVVSAQRNRFHPVREYLESLTWDGTPRIEHWLEDVYESTTGREYLAKVGPYFLIGAVARIMRPGCKMDNVLILEGKQGLKKSTSLSVLFGDWFSDAPIPIGEKDAYQNIQGVWCCEMAELDSFNKAESNSAKMFFSQRRDRYRPSYGRNAQDFNRQCIFVGTTNQSEYLKDYSGNRRYWPVRCLTVNIETLKENRDQYFAEAMHRLNAGEPWWPGAAEDEVFDQVQADRMQVDPWQFAIEDYLLNSTRDYFTADDILTGAIEKDLKTVTRADQNRISPILKALGYSNKRKRIQVGARKISRHVYVKSDETDE